MNDADACRVYAIPDEGRPHRLGYSDHTVRAVPFEGTGAERDASCADQLRAAQASGQDGHLQRMRIVAMYDLVIAGGAQHLQHRPRIRSATPMNRTHGQSLAGESL